MFIQVLEENSEWWEKVFTLYQSAFPESERISERNFKEKSLFENGFLLAGIENQHLCALASVFHLQGLEFSLLNYLAVSREFQKKGLGGKMLLKVLEYCREKKRKVFLEIEDPEQGENRSQRLSRLKFYERQGFRMLTISSVIPIGDQNEWVKTRLLSESGSYEAAEKIKDQLVQALMLQNYGILL